MESVELVTNQRKKTITKMSSEQRQHTYNTRGSKLARLEQEKTTLEQQHADALSSLQSKLDDQIKKETELKTKLSQAEQRLQQQQQTSTLQNSTATYHWEWKSDGAWMPYNAQQSFELETAYAGKLPCVQFTIGKYPYLVDLLTMEQTNVGGEYHTKRAMRRVPDAVPIRLPMSWISQSTSSAETKRVEIAAGSPAYVRVEQLLKDRGFDARRCKLIKVQTVEAPMRQRLFEARCDDIKSRLDHKVSHLPCLEVFHGTSAAALDSIVKYGFNRDHTKRQEYGAGVYFAYHPQLALTYAKEKALIASTSTQDYVVVIAFLCVGNITVAQRAARAIEMPHKPNGFPYETLVDLVSHPSIFVSSLDDQAFAQLIITCREVV